MSNLKAGQFWRDTVNGDLLKILSFNQEPNSNLSRAEGVGGYVDYARCACFVSGVYFGVQEMKTSHFKEERFKKVNFITQWWYRRKFRKGSPGAQPFSG